MNTLNKDQWLEEVYKLLCNSQGEPENAEQVKNLRDWADTMAMGGDSYFEMGYTPKEAYDEELSYL